MLHPIAQLIQPLLVALCCFLAWGLVLMTGWSLVVVVRDTAVQTREMHKIPCSNCRFFTHHYYLKCTVHPSNALTEAAINCLDYEED